MSCNNPTHYSVALQYDENKLAHRKWSLKAQGRSRWHS
ncbi:hypothetical protein ACNKHX_11670 [Shigella flexneri]